MLLTVNYRSRCCTTTAAKASRPRLRPCCAALSSRSRVRHQHPADLSRREDFVVRASERNEGVESTSQSVADDGDRPEDFSDVYQLVRAQIESGEQPDDILMNLSKLEEKYLTMEKEYKRQQPDIEASQGVIEDMKNEQKIAKDKYLRLSADFDNFRRRTVSEKDQLTRSVKGGVVSELLPLLDNFESARTQVKTETEGEQRVNNAYQSLYKQIVETMRGLGVEAVPTVGKPFDPSIHDAIMREENDDVEDGTVLMEFRKGFTLNDKLLRPAMVKVSFSDAPPKKGGRPRQEEASENANAEPEAAVPKS